jgi:hypothetical protein
LNESETLVAWPACTSASSVTSVPFNAPTGRLAMAVGGTWCVEC